MITKEEIINGGIHFYYPDFAITKEKQKEVDNIKSFSLPYIAMKYEGMDLNDHHYTTEYHLKYVIPLYSNVLRADMDLSDWEHVDNIITQEDGKIFDLSYVIPKKDKRFHVKCITKECEYDCNYSGLMYNEKVDGITWLTPYHRLYCLPHLCSVVENKSDNNGRTLLLIGDSQSVPDIPILSYFFKEVWYIDNRDSVNVMEIIEKGTFTDIVYAQSCFKDEYYYNFLK